MIIFYHKSKDPAIIWLVDSGLLKYSSGLHFLVQSLLVTAPRAHPAQQSSLWAPVSVVM